MTSGPNPQLNVLVFAASLRADSLNRKLAALAARVAAQNGATVDLASMRDFDVPLYDGDLEKAAGIPKGAEELKRRLLTTATRSSCRRPSTTARCRARSRT